MEFDRAVKLKFHGARVSSDAGLFPYRDLDEAAQLTESAATTRFGRAWRRTQWNQLLRAVE